MNCVDSFFYMRKNLWMKASFKIIYIFAAEYMQNEAISCSSIKQMQIYEAVHI